MWGLIEVGLMVAGVVLVVILERWATRPVDRLARWTALPRERWTDTRLSVDSESGLVSEE